MKTIVVVIILFVATTAQATGVDLHRMWDDRCIECHGHAGDFARTWLSVADKKLQGRHHIHDLRQFLINHYLAEGEVDAVYDMLLAQATNPPRFRDECSRCHHSAAEFVRNSLKLHNGVLYDRTSGIPIRSLLNGHQKLTSDDAEFFSSLLTRVAREIYRP